MDGGTEKMDRWRFGRGMKESRKFSQSPSQFREKVLSIRIKSRKLSPPCDITEVIQEITPSGDDDTCVWEIVAGDIAYIM